MSLLIESSDELRDLDQVLGDGARILVHSNHGALNMDVPVHKARCYKRTLSVNNTGLLAKKELTYMRGDKQKVVNLETTFAGYKISESSSETCISFELDTLQEPHR